MIELLVDNTDSVSRLNFGYTGETFTHEEIIKSKKKSTIYWPI